MQPIQPKVLWMRRGFANICRLLPTFARLNTIFIKMKFVSENIIDEVIEELDELDENQYELRMEAFARSQPVIVAYLFNEENFHLLNEDEKGFLQYLSLISWMAFEKVNPDAEPASEDMIGEAEESNYALLEKTTGKTFRDRLNIFFEGYGQEDLLAFVEEAVLEDEDDPEALVTKEGREPIFVAAKTVIDALIF